MIRPACRKAYGGMGRFLGAGPTRTRPDVSKTDPWQGQNQPPYAPRWSIGTHPRCVQFPNVTSHCALPGLVLASSVCGSMRSSSFVARAALISSTVLWRTKIKRPRQNNFVSCPTGIGARSSSTGCPDATMEASEAIEPMSGQSAADVPNAAMVPVPRKRISRREAGLAVPAVGSTGIYRLVTLDKFCRRFIDCNSRGSRQLGT
jgi:hypothetical protein